MNYKWSLQDVADYFGISRRLARVWIVQQDIIPFRLRRVGWRVMIEITTEEMLKLIDLKRPAYGSGSPLDTIFERKRRLKRKASIAGVLARARKREQRQQQP